jgi:hypothetical protein
MNKIKFITPIRVDEEMFNLVKNIKIDRIKIGTDRIPESDRRITKALARLVKQDVALYNTLIKSQLENDRRYKRR